MDHAIHEGRRCDFISLRVDGCSWPAPGSDGMAKAVVGWCRSAHSFWIKACAVWTARSCSTSDESACQNIFARITFPGRMNARDEISSGANSDKRYSIAQQENVLDPTREGKLWNVRNCEKNRRTAIMQESVVEPKKISKPPRLGISRSCGCRRLEERNKLSANERKKQSCSDSQRDQT